MSVIEYDDDKDQPMTMQDFRIKQAEARGLLQGLGWGAVFATILLALIGLMLNAS